MQLMYTPRGGQGYALDRESLSRGNHGKSKTSKAKAKSSRQTREYTASKDYVEYPNLRFDVSSGDDEDEDDADPTSYEEVAKETCNYVLEWNAERQDIRTGSQAHRNIQEKTGSKARCDTKKTPREEDGRREQRYQERPNRTSSRTKDESGAKPRQERRDRYGSQQNERPKDSSSRRQHTRGESKTQASPANYNQGSVKHQKDNPGRRSSGSGYDQVSAGTLTMSGWPTHRTRNRGISIPLRCRLREPIHVQDFISPDLGFKPLICRSRSLV
ncbi:hypothetical protein BU23DRAFT_571929 [Bimuria novae-zelandiae CBS 107.79]|uniref:Uncharacterized protein n=1 Tax=Bimuria novae-zelandiae CBS 107.79 TaxID=1447943 RepID=A0A6A5UW57_9PLEO|nr:hypothetical protein BU23DRAFT_571929 [Bimuria novae-zelandiae CBS 107.79]